MSSPLQGYRVLELAGVGPCPFTGMMLADWGLATAEVELLRKSGAVA